MERILLWSRVDRTYLVKKIQAFIHNSGIHCELVVLSDDMWNGGQLYCDYFECMKKETNANMNNVIKNLILKYSVVGVIVASNYDLNVIVDMAEWLNERNVRFFSPDSKTLKLCLSKRMQYVFLRSHGFDVPDSYFFDIMDDREKENILFPLIAKPDNGQGSEGIIEITSADELSKYFHSNGTIIFQKKSNGAEYTVDCFNDFAGNLLIAIPRKRVRIIGSHSTASLIELNSDIIGIAKRLSSLIYVSGPWNFQLFNDNGRFLIHDINPRLSNGIGFCISCGAPFEELIVNHLLNNIPPVDVNFSINSNLAISYTYFENQNNESFPK